MKKIRNICYIVVCLLICILPFTGMLVYNKEIVTEQGTESSASQNREKDDVWYTDFPEKFSDYFSSHLAFRDYLISGDSEIQSRLFGVSNVDTVIVGTEGWLYYKDTLDDYLGQNRMSERSIYNAAHNLALLQQYVTEQGADFVFTVAPNKNSLYGQNMPYYMQHQVSEEKNMTLFQPALEKAGVSYVDLFAAFEEQEETLYLKRDSHWNQKGAILAYHTLLDSLQVEHNTYEDTDAVREKNEIGDLNQMLYPATAKPEWNYIYQNENTFSYVTDTESVEDAWIETENGKGSGNVLMFRDSFGNTLLPLMANQFEKGYFSKSVPYRITEYMEKTSPNLVIVEKVERNIDEFAKKPPIMEAPEVSLDGELKEKLDGTSLQKEISGYDASFWTFSGILDESIKDSSNVYLRLTIGDESRTYEAFTITMEESDYGYQLYLPVEVTQKGASEGEKRLKADVIAKKNGEYFVVHSEELEIN